MPKMKYSTELKEQVLADYEATKDAILVAKKHGITPKIVWQWKAVVNARPKKQEELEFKKLKRENAKLLMENSLLRDIIKKTAMVMPID